MRLKSAASLAVSLVLCMQMTSCALVKKVDEGTDENIGSKSEIQTTETITETETNVSYVSDTIETSFQDTTTTADDDNDSIYLYGIEFIKTDFSQIKYAPKNTILYKQPSKDSDSINTSQEEEVVVNAVSNDGTWTYVALDGASYFIKSNQLKTETTTTTATTTTSPKTTTSMSVTYDTTTSSSTKKQSSTTSTTSETTTRKTTTTVQTQAVQANPSTTAVYLKGLEISYSGGIKVEGDYLSKDEFSVIANYSDGSSASVSNWTSSSISRALSKGENTIDISYSGCSGSIIVSAYEKGGISYPSNPSSTSVNFGVTFADVNKTYRVVQDNVDASSGPGKVANSTGYTSLAKFNVDDKVTCTGIGKNGWCRVDLGNGKVGFVYNEYLK